MASVVVIGAGIGGLAVAARLSAQGHAVRVFEASAKPGGKVAGYERAGHVFDTGPSLLTLPAIYRDLFLKTAVRRKNASLEDNVGLVGLDPAFSYRWSDGTSAVLPGSNTNRVSGAFQEALGGDAGAQWQAFSERASHIWAATRSSFLEKPIDGPRDLLREMRRLSDLRTVAPWKSLRSLGQEYLTDPRLRMVLDRYATYSGSDPRQAPAALAVIPFVEQTFGAWHIEGGVHRLGNAVYKRCLERHVSFDFSSAVRRVVLKGGRASGCRDRRRSNHPCRRGRVRCRCLVGLFPDVAETVRQTEVASTGTCHTIVFRFLSVAFAARTRWRAFAPQCAPANELRG